MRKLVFYVEVNEDNNKLIIDKDGDKVPAFQFNEEMENNKDKIKIYCENLYKSFLGISGRENINISVMEFSEISRTYPVYFSYYGRGSRFIEH